MKNPIGLNQKSYKKTVRWAVDFDYLDKLTDEAKIFLSKFAREWYENHFDFNPLHKKCPFKTLENCRKYCDGKCQKSLNREGYHRRTDSYSIQDSGNALLKFGSVEEEHAFGRSSGGKND